MGFDASRHHLAVIDIGLPDGCGLDLIQRLRRDGQQVGIVVFSARRTSPDRIMGLGMGADHYLGKGCDLDELAATLAVRTLRNSGYCFYQAARVQA
ncbi:MAG: response regulator transcription factor [Achromobacter sp.]